MQIKTKARSKLQAEDCAVPSTKGRDFDAGTRLGRSTTPGRELDKAIAGVVEVKRGKIRSADVNATRDQRAGGERQNRYEMNSISTQ